MNKIGVGYASVTDLEKKYVMDALGTEVWERNPHHVVAGILESLPASGTIVEVAEFLRVGLVKIEQPAVWCMRTGHETRDAQVHIVNVSVVVVGQLHLGISHFVGVPIPTDDNHVMPVEIHLVGRERSHVGNMENVGYNRNGNVAVHELRQGGHGLVLVVAESHLMIGQTQAAGRIAIYFRWLATQYQQR